MVETEKFIVGCVTEVTNLQEGYSTGTDFFDGLRRNYTWDGVPKYIRIY